MKVELDLESTMAKLLELGTLVGDGSLLKSNIINTLTSTLEEIRDYEEHLLASEQKLTFLSVDQEERLKREKEGRGKTETYATRAQVNRILLKFKEIFAQFENDYEWCRGEVGKLQEGMSSFKEQLGTSVGQSVDPKAGKRVS